MSTIASEQIQLTFGDDPFEISLIKNRVTGQTLCRNGEQSFLLRLPSRLSDPIFLRQVTTFSTSGREAHFALTDTSGDYQLACTVQASAHGLHFRVEVTSPEPVWMVEWKVLGLQLHEVIAPALGGQAITHEMPGDAQLSYKYPFWWNAQFAIGVSAPEEGGIWLRTMDQDPIFKVLRVHKVEEQEDLFALGIGIEASGPLESCTLTAEWYLDGFEGSWKTPVDIHRQWLETAFDLVPQQNHPHFPSWAKEINFVLEIWGMRRDIGRPAHTFSQMRERIEAFAKMHPPQQTLLYLPGFAENGIDSNAPSYEPSEQLGGRAGFAQLIDRAHTLGYRVMIHTNVLAMAFTHPQFSQFKEHQVVDLFGQRQGWGLDMDGDWLAEPYFAYINPGVHAWGELMASILGDLIHSFNLDGVFLDQTLLAFNVSQGPNFIQGMRAHIQSLQRKFPHVLFSGEGLHEQVVPVLPMAQIHGIDSIARVHGIEGQHVWRRVHPVSTYLFGKYTKYVPHLLTKHPTNSMFERQEAAYQMVGIVPSLVLYNQSQSLQGPEVEQMLQRARQLHQVISTVSSA
jgi:hypothetical protein